MKRRIEKNQVILLMLLFFLRCAAKPAQRVLMDNNGVAGTQIDDIFFYAPGSFSILLDEGNLLRTSREGFETQGATTGKNIQAAALVDIGL